MIFGAPLSGAMVGTSVIAPAIAVGLYASARRVAYRRRDPLRMMLLPLLGLVLASLVGLLGWLNYSYAPTGYEISTTAVIVRMRRCRKTIPLSTIRGAHVDHERRFASAYSPWRMFAPQLLPLSGPWGLVVECRLSGIGRVRAYVTDPQRPVVLETEPITIVSPDRPDAFVAAVHSALRR